MSEPPRFDQVAAAYDRGRPPYPAELFDGLERLIERPLRGLDVLDVGAGTGIATRAMRARGATVVALDHGALVLDVLRSRSPDIPVVRADADELPFADATFDLVSYAQSFHWTDPARSIPTALRVLRSGGALALWWNLTDRASAPWIADHERRIAAACPEYHGNARPDAANVLARYSLDIDTLDVRWSRTVDHEVFLASLRSKSYVSALGDEGADAFVAAERALLPDAELTEPFVSYLVVARTRR